MLASRMWTWPSPSSRGSDGPSPLRITLGVDLALERLLPAESLDDQAIEVGAGELGLDAVLRQTVELHPRIGRDGAAVGVASDAARSAGPAVSLAQRPRRHSVFVDPQRPAHVR